ncbi:MAG: methylmalonyl Co-A mutase-associated GTPase MeaB [Bacteroidetes bacterium]|nr:methylmalonyl Co-A mutase-associated GTPase MeaB [Bacteroidota bacterium]MBS1756236.1 methylmalonyl Co-A mutase-associated GTPase MeaB [Bacteroidota bacterium]
MWLSINEGIEKGDIKSIARAISLVENETKGYEELLINLSSHQQPVIGITGPPGAGKSTLVDALIDEMIQQQKKIAILCVDPSSPFNLGALLGDRIRMSAWYNHPNVYIRSLATRGSLGGLHPKIIEITDVLKAAPFDYIIVETVGVGQSEIEIAGLADITIVTVVPEAGDEIQTMKAGLMEIADIFIVNKADRPGADVFIKNLKQMLAPAFNNHAAEIPVLKTIANKKEGVAALLANIEILLQGQHTNDKKYWLLAEKAYFLIQQKKMKAISKQQLKQDIEAEGERFNLYKFIQQY